MSNPKPAPPLGQAVDRFLATLKAESTRRNRGQALNPMVARFGADLPLTDLDPADVADWMQDQWGPRSAGTWNSRAASIRAAYTWWKDRRWITRDDLDEALGAVKRVPGREALPAEILTTSEVEALLGALGDERRYVSVVRNRALITLMYRSGLRLGEALAIRPSDLDFATHSIRLRRTKSGRAQTRGFHPAADDALMRWIDRRAEQGINGTAPLFCAVWDWHGGEKPSTGAAISPDYVRQMMTRLGKRAGIGKRVYPHMLRHTFAAEMEQAGVSPGVIRHLMGHSSVAVTAKYLDHLTNHEAVQALADVQVAGWEPGGEPDLKAQVAQLQRQVAQLLAGKTRPEGSTE